MFPYVSSVRPAVLFVCLSCHQPSLQDSVKEAWLADWLDGWLNGRLDVLLYGWVDG